ncbi:MlaD family protein [Bryobacter aggregatus]|uniref:MlaD family protein n=1 Tax=Bryobacter aggregatus TaxID=360054 RepID=UPI0004E0F0A9|nr:MlaD family protein [Bryobacter aggregatus]
MTSKKTTWAQLRVGLLAIAGLVLLAVLVFYITSTQNLFESRSKVYAYLDTSGGLLKSAPVRLNGVLVGKVTEIVLSGENSPNRIIRVTMEIDDRMMSAIPNDSKVTVGAENLLGAKLIAIKKGVAPVSIAKGGELPSGSTPELDDIQQQASQTIAVMQNILTKAEGIVGQVEAGKGTIGKLLVDEELYNRFLSITKEVDKLSASLNQGRGTLGKLLSDDALYTDVRKTISRVDQVIADIQAGQGTAGKLLKDEAVYNEAKASLVEMRKLLSDLNAGQGTAGKLLKDDTLAKQLSATIGRVDTLLDKVNRGDGTLGQLLVNPSLYENLNGTAVELKSLMKDFRANPKKFLRIKLALF